jgi:hypothetical protein
MKTSRTTFRAFRLPNILDASTRAAAKAAGVSQTEIIVQILVTALRAGHLPQPKSAEDKRQLAFL